MSQMPYQSLDKKPEKILPSHHYGTYRKENPRLGEDFLLWADEDTIVKVILNTYKFAKEYIDPKAPGEKNM